MLTFRSGGWVLVLAAALTIGIACAALLANRGNLSKRAVGDGRRAESYGFDLSTCLVPREAIVPAGPDLRKDGLPVPTDPPALAARMYTPDTRLAGVRRLTTHDRILGVEIDGQARAYPLWVMCWHEIVNDTLGGRPIAVTYSPLCDSAVVFDRNVAGKTRTFSISGLLYNSNLLMYDRRPDGRGESLWSQLQFRAVAGPAARAGRRLRVRPCVVEPWGRWLARHPETTISLPDPQRKRLYVRDAYAVYFGLDHLSYPVEPLPPAGSWKLKTPIVAWRADNVWRVARADRGPPPTVPAAAPRAYAFWFAWYAMHPDSRVFSP